MKILTILLATLAILSCGASTRAATTLSPEQALAVRTSVIAWIECEECTDGELERLLKYGELAVPTLGAMLERGPSPANLERYRLHLENSYRELADYSRTHAEVKMNPSQEQYVEQYLANYRALYAVRSAQALAKVGGDTARGFLEAASKRPMRADVDLAIRESLKAMRR